MIESYEGVEILLDGLNDSDINSLLKKWNDISLIRVKLDNLDAMLRTKIKIYLKERSWNRYIDENNKISVNLFKSVKSTVDMKELKRFLSASEMTQVVKTTEYEKLVIMTKEAREKVKKIIRGKADGTV